MALKNVLLLGGSGFVGSHLTRLLTDRGINVTIPTRRRERTKQLIMLPLVDMVEADINDEETLVRLMKGQDAVINLVGLLHTTDSTLTYGPTFGRAHVELPKKIVSACQRSGVRRLVHMSALKATDNAPSEYLRSKAAGEAVVLAAQGSLDVTVFRPSVIFGVGDSFLTAFAELLEIAPVFPVGGADARFQPVYVGDVVEAFANSLTDQATFGKAYDLCGPKVYSLRELIAYVGEISGHPRKIIALNDFWAYLQAGLLMLAPKPLLSPDNLRSMQVDSVADAASKAPANWQPMPLEAIAPTYLSAKAPRVRYNTFRLTAGR